MIRIFLISICLLSYGCKKDKAIPKEVLGYKLTFQDEFNDSILNRTKWKTNFESGQMEAITEGLFVDSAFSVKNGILKIEVKKQKATGTIYDKDSNPIRQTFDFTCGLINTRRLFEQSTGYFEGRIKFPKGKGYWNAFWMMSNDGWPPEIDIIEMKGSDTHSLQLTQHFKTENKDHEQRGHKVTGNDYASDFHIYGIEWTPKEIKWFIDGALEFVSRKNIPLNKMYLILSVGVGGSWPGPTDSSTPEIAYLEVDYIRAYKKVVN